ncbi:hypothetical protein E4U41_007043 [Claviceps citrina]|nr:hypothetical protein E4U41_007043 [Claviceps citrina]
MAKKAKARLINVRLLSMAMTGFFYTFKRPRTSPLMGMMKYDPIGMGLPLAPSWRLASLLSGPRGTR